MKMLTKQELARQNFVDNEIFSLLQKLFPTEHLVWNTEKIGAVRDIILNQVIERNSPKGIQFYP